MAKPIQATPILNKKESAKFLKKMKEVEKREITIQEKELTEDIKKNFGESNIILTIKKGTDAVKIGSLISVLAELDIVEKINASFPILPNPIKEPIDFLGGKTIPKKMKRK